MEPIQSEQYSDEESIQRRNKTLREMLSTPPQQHATNPPQTAQSRKKAAQADDAPKTLKQMP